MNILWGMGILQITLGCQILLKIYTSYACVHTRHFNLHQTDSD